MLKKRIKQNLQVQLRAEALRLSRLLKRTQTQLVLCESCTGGQAAAALVAFPGMSAHLCGSLVVYQNETKNAWLNISKKTLKNPGAVSKKVAVEMVLGALHITPRANIAASITGHLAPLAPEVSPSQLGQVYLAVAFRTETKPKVFYSDIRIPTPQATKILTASSFTGAQSNTMLRIQHQLAASHSLLMMVRSLLEYTRSKGES